MPRNKERQNTQRPKPNITNRGVLRDFADGFFDDVLVILNFVDGFEADDDGIDAAEVEDEIGAFFAKLAVVTDIRPGR